MKMESGSAGIIIELENGVITVYHQEDNSVLFKRKAKQGDWDMLWGTIQNIGQKKNIKEVV